MPVEIATDNFNRADAASLGANWTGSVPNSSLGIASNQATAATDAQDNAAFWNANSFFTDQYAQVTLATLQSNSASGLLVRASATDNVLGQTKNFTSDMAIYWYNGGVYTQIGSTYTTSGFSNGDVMRLEADGPTFTLYQNGVSRVTGTNTSAPKKGAAGILITEDADRLEDWSGGNLYSFGILDFTSVEESPVSGTVDINITIPTGYSNYGLVLTTQCRDNVDARRNITGVVWNTSEAFTPADEENNDTLDLTVEQWLLPNPTVGANTAKITYAGAAFRTRATLIVLAGMSQSTTPNAIAGASGTSTTPSAAPTTTVDGCIVIDSVFDKFEAGPTAGAGQQPLDSTTVSAGADGVGTSYERKVTAGAVTMSWTSSSDDWCISAVAYAPYVAPATTVKHLAALGVG